MGKGQGHRRIPGGAGHRDATGDRNRSGPAGDRGQRVLLGHRRPGGRAVVRHRRAGLGQGIGPSSPPSAHRAGHAAPRRATSCTTGTGRPMATGNPSGDLLPTLGRASVATGDDLSTSLVRSRLAVGPPGSRLAAGPSGRRSAGHDDRRTWRPVDADHPARHQPAGVARPRSQTTQNPWLNRTVSSVRRIAEVANARSRGQPRQRGRVSTSPRTTQTPIAGSR